MKIVSLTNAKARLSSYAKASRKEPIVLTCKGKPLAVMYGMDEDDLERLKMANSPEVRRILAAANRRIDKSGGIPHDQFWEEMARTYPKELGRPESEKQQKPLSPKTKMPDANIAIIDRVIDSCKQLLNRTSFWLLAGMADASFEEGDRKNRRIRDWVSECEKAGIDSDLARQLRAGINGNLKEILEQRRDVHVEHQPDRGADLILSDDCGGSAHVQVKYTWQMTEHDYYRKEIVGDRRKLTEERDAGYTGDLIQVIFLLDLPNYYYPEGCWYGRDNVAKNRIKISKINWGITRQWNEIKRHIPEPPFFPAKDPPYLQKLSFPTNEISSVKLKSLFNKLCKPLSPFDFAPEAQMKDAAVGLAIWML